MNPFINVKFRVHKHVPLLQKHARMQRCAATATLASPLLVQHLHPPQHAEPAALQPHSPPQPSPHLSASLSSPGRSSSRASCRWAMRRMEVPRSVCSPCRTAASSTSCCSCGDGSGSALHPPGAPRNVGSAEAPPAPAQCPARAAAPRCTCNGL